MDYLKYFWQGEKVSLPPLRGEDAEHSYAKSLDSWMRRVLQLGADHTPQETWVRRGGTG